ncbi:MAG: hypothetical protein K6B14_08960 [Lachnospiraceae bacterium]|nr:hypothetical protein [Lachnospiraceae bacterium]
MLSEKRVIKMTRMAMDEKNDARYYYPVANISKKDYVGAYGVVAFIIGTITYAAIFLGVMAVLFNSVIVNIDETLVLLIGVLAVLGYLFHLFLYIFFTRRRAARRYKVGREALERRMKSIRELEEIYVEEEENRSPTISMQDMEDLI